jgi:UDP-N-acetylmuramoyl-L-alanyl-D-glutamate--2,6-diaminopimelate ligase
MIAMTLRELIAGAGSDLSSLRPSSGQAPEGSPEADLGVDVTGLAYRADAVSAGDLFFCVPGMKADGHDFAPAAVARGAKALVCERPLGLGVAELVVADVRSAMPLLAASFCARPSGELELVGVTGTNGKTTTAFLVRAILEHSGRRTGLLGTVQSVVGGAVEEVERTTPESIDLQRVFRRMVDSGDTACAMEVSSHALELHRADAIDFDCAVFTNLSQDHLDFHGSLETYFGAKRKLFEPSLSTAPGVAVVNVDDEWGRRLVQQLAESAREVVTFGVECSADFHAEDIDFGPAGSAFTCRTDGAALDVQLPLPGLFNVYNALGAIAACSVLGVGPESAVEALREAPQVPGRFESIDEGQRFLVIVDYAHTPDSLANVLRAARELLDRDGKDGRLVCVFGAGGDRDRDKRPLMGEAARRLADQVIVTSDNPRSEDPDAIIAAIVAGAQAAGDVSPASALEVEPDRRAAIMRALRLAGRGDIVVIAGKGHEQGQEFANGHKVPFDDREVAREELRALLESASSAA